MPEDSSYVWFHIGKAYSFLMSERQPRATDSSLQYPSCYTSVQCTLNQYIKYRKLVGYRLNMNIGKAYSFLLSERQLRTTDISLQYPASYSSVH